MRAASRLVDVSINTVTKLLIDVGAACWSYQNEVMRGLPCKRVQCDEIWSFCYAKEKNVPKEHKGELGYGDIYTWVAIDADTRLVLTWLAGRRDDSFARAFIGDLAGRLANRVQITTDGHSPYLGAVQRAFGNEVDYAMLQKRYGRPEEQRRYSPPQIIGISKRRMIGNPDQKEISTSYIERQNLSMRMGMRRYTRLTNGFSKKLANHDYALAIYYMHYNFAKIHKTLRVTPAMETGISDHVWTLEEIARLAE